MCQGRHFLTVIIHSARQISQDKYRQLVSEFEYIKHFSSNDDFRLDSKLESAVLWDNCSEIFRFRCWKFSGNQGISWIDHKFMIVYQISGYNLWPGYENETVWQDIMRWTVNRKPGGKNQNGLFSIWKQ